MSTIVSVPVQRLTAASFAPFGDVLGPKDSPPDFEGTMSVGWRAPFHVTGEIALLTLHNRPSGFRFNWLERHFDVTQTFIPLGSIPFVVAVAAPTGDEAPDPASVRAFLVDGTAGYLLHRGTWHSLDRYPIYSENLNIVMITGESTQQDITTRPPEQMELSEQIDYSERFGVVFDLDVANVDLSTD
jgi:ureidoglycolate lyase